MNRRSAFVLAASVLAPLAAWVALQPTMPRPRHAPEAPATEPDVPAARVTIAADGVLSLAIADAADRPIGKLFPADEATQRAALDSLRTQLERWHDADAIDAGRRPRPTLDLVVAPATPWVSALWILEIVSSGAVGMAQVRLGVPAATAPSFTYDLAYHRRAADADGWRGATRLLEVRLTEEDGIEAASGSRKTRVAMAMTSVPDLDWVGPPSNPDHFDWTTSWATYDGVRRLTADVRGASSAAAACLVDIPRPQRLRVLCGDVLPVLRALRDEEIAPIRLLNPSTALPGDR